MSTLKYLPELEKNLFKIKKYISVSVLLQILYLLNKFIPDLMCCMVVS